jgi:hypothetical protein
MKKILFICAMTLAVAAAVAQFFQPARTNPPVDPAASFAVVAKPSGTVVAVVERACRDCHTNHTVWPWYSKVSPISWLVASDVEEGRARLNFSQWSIYGPEMTQIRLREACEEVKAGKMPLPHYVPLHPEARLSDWDITAFCAAAQ